MNPQEVIWKVIRSKGFKNVIFYSLKAVVDKFYDVVGNMTNSEIISATRWSWIDKILRQCF